MKQKNQAHPAVAGSRQALLVIDVQQGLFHKSTPIYRAEALLNTLEALIERAHDANVPVIYVQHASDKVLPFGSADWQLHPRLHPRAGELIIHKAHGNAFEDTPLHEALAAHGAGAVVVTGLVTHGCVRATCQGALDLGYAVTLVSDGHSSYSKDAAKLVEEWNHRLAQTGALVEPAAGVTFGLQSA